MKIFITITSLILLISCKKDKADILYSNSDNCDTLNMSYATHIAPILKSNCTMSGCHSSVSNAAGYAYETYNETKITVDNGRLLGSIKHLSGFSSMPKGGGKLNDCNIKKIQSWVNKGALNN